MNNRMMDDQLAYGGMYHNGDPREAPYVPEPKYFDKLPGIFAKAKGKTLIEQADAVTEAISSALASNSRATTTAVPFVLDRVLVMQLSEQSATAQIDGSRTVLNW
jgi:hypothetical protein